MVINFIKIIKIVNQMWKFIFAPKLSDVMTSPNLSANYGLRKVFGLKLSDVMTSPMGVNCALSKNLPTNLVTSLVTS